MSLETLRTLVAIADCGSFAGAARVLGLSESAVSTQVKSLEAELKTELFDRSKRPPALNEAGKSVIARARTLLESYADMQRELKLGDPVEGRIRLGAVGSTLTGLVPTALTVIRRRYPNLHIEIVSGFSADLLRLVGNRSLDAAIISDYDSSLRDIRWRPFLRERLVIIAPPDAREQNPKLLVQKYSFIRYSPSAAVGRIIDKAIKQAKLEIRETMQLDWIEAIEAMVQHGHGISIVPERRLEGDNFLAVKRINFGAMPHYRTLGIVEPINSRKQKLIDVLFDELIALVRRPIPSIASGLRPKPRN